MELKKPYVFISYSRKDYIDENKNIIPDNPISKIVEAFDNAKINRWIDLEGVYAGDSFAPIIGKAIQDCDLFLFISSKNSNSSQYTCAEIASARNFNKKIIPIKIDKTPYDASIVVYIAHLDAIEYYSNHEKGIKNLLRGINSHFSRIEEDARRAEEEKEREREAARKRAEELQRQKELEEQQHKAEQQRIYSDIKLSCDALNNEEAKHWWDRKTLISQTERIEDPAQKEMLSSYISTSSPIRKKIEEEFKALFEKVKELEMTIQSLSQKKEELVQANGDLAKTNGELNQRIEAMEMQAKTTEQERKAIARIGQLQDDLISAKDEADKYKKNWHYWYYEWKGKKKFCWFLGITVLLFIVTFAFFWLHGNIKFSSHGDIKPTPKTFLYKDPNKVESLTPQQLTSKGLDYFHGQNGRTQDYDSAFRYFRDAAEQGDASGQYWLGYMYDNGDGVELNYIEAVKWYQKAAEQGNASGQNNLGVMYQNGYGVEKNYTEAVKWYQKAAEQGNAAGQSNLGYMYQYGYGVEKNYTEAVKWYQKAAEQGYSMAQNNLGERYYYGEGVTHDYKQAVYWYTKAAEQGNAYAQYNLGWMYEHGEAVEKDLTVAKKFYQKAADNGYEEAQKKLEELN